MKPTANALTVTPPGASPSFMRSQGGEVQPSRPSKSYDPNGSNVLRTVTDPAGKRLRDKVNTYDECGPAQRPRRMPPASRWPYEYDPVGNRFRGHRWPQSAHYGLHLRRPEPQLDDQFRRAAVNVTTFTYDPASTNTSGPTPTWPVHQRLQLRHPQLGDGGGLLWVRYPSAENRTYAYDDARRPALGDRARPQPGGKADVAYTYDALHRVVTETSNGATHHLPVRPGRKPAWRVSTGKPNGRHRPKTGNSSTYDTASTAS